MAANERTTERLKARQKAGINEDLARKLRDLDALTGDKADFAQILCHAIKKLSEREDVADVDRSTIASLARQAAYWTMDLANEINVFAEEVGCNDRSRGGVA